MATSPQQLRKSDRVLVTAIGRCALIAVASTILSIQGGAADGDWPHFLGPEYNNSSPETGLLHEFPKGGMVPTWQYEKGAGHSTPAIGSGRLVLFHAIESDEVIDCLDAVSGERLWRHRYPAPFTPRYGAGPGPKTNPVIDGDRVFTLGVNATLVCLNLKTGNVIWKRELAKYYPLRPTFFGQGGTPLARDGRVVVTLGTKDNKAIVAFDQTNGREIWAARHVWASSYSSPVHAQLHGRDCILVLQGGMADPPTGGLLILDANDGRILSEVPHRSRMFASVSVSSPVVIGHRVFVSEAYTEGGLCTEIGSGFTAKVAWRAPEFDTYLMTAVHQAGHLYGFAGQHQQNAALVCYELESGQEKWRADLGGVFQRGSLIRADESFLCLGENGDLAWINLSPAGAELVAQTKLFDAPECWTPPVISYGRLYVCQNQPGNGGSKPRLNCYTFRTR